MPKIYVADKPTVDEIKSEVTNASHGLKPIKDAIDNVGVGW